MEIGSGVRAVKISHTLSREIRLAKHPKKAECHPTSFDYREGCSLLTHLAELDEVLHHNRFVRQRHLAGEPNAQLLQRVLLLRGQLVHVLEDALLHLVRWMHLEILLDHEATQKLRRMRRGRCR